MSTLWLTPTQADELVGVARDAIPEEVCGVLVGIDGCVKSVIVVPNAAQDRTTAFRLDDRMYAEALFAARRANLHLLAYFHSHPRGAPVPSTTDIAQAADFETPHLLIGLGHQYAELALWQITGSRVIRLSLHIGIAAPVPEQSSRSNVTTGAIVITALLSFIVVIVIALALLPPAPTIPAP